MLLEETKEINGRLYMTGHTKEYIQAAVETAENMANSMVRGTITGFLTDEILLLNFLSR